MNSTKGDVGSPDICCMEAYLSAVRQADTQSQIAYAVARKSLDVMKAEGEGAIKLLESAVKLHEQAVGDVQQSSVKLQGYLGVGGNVDVMG